ncbi:MAG: hypothetical protein A3A13_03105 [Candidatus Yanofskybacteria bacterium RIFCSPLOWO2_01_FULL_43_22]|uniref:Uncharacterized protein n=1 Tax=Candidatus Yanofskybacteria bacterium RIFCSPLOWO2_01_FULL_43_22 TaxID=1802695 RepID=A0A1F8GJ80_9BACT|nr:MAG: hypothetical protein A3A13_03105 [Candidatus Yanofskybacteria bacterium RIFCSPLOWO2_01_FULL_43_22]
MPQGFLSVSRDLFEEIIKKGRTIPSGILNFRYIFSVSGRSHLTTTPLSKVFRTKVARNKAKRRVLAALRGIATPLPGVCGIFFIKKTPNEVSKDEFAHEIEMILKKIIIR